MTEQVQHPWGGFFTGHDDIVPLEVAFDVNDVVVSVVPEGALGISVVESERQFLTLEAIVVGVEAVLNIPCAF